MEISPKFVGTVSTLTGSSNNGSSRMAEILGLVYVNRCPDLPLYVDIQETLCIYGRGLVELVIRKFRRSWRTSRAFFSERIFEEL